MKKTGSTKHSDMLTTPKKVHPSPLMSNNSMLSSAATHGEEMN